MKRYKIVYLPDAERRLAAIEDYIADKSSPAIAKRYVEGLGQRVARLSRFPLRGSPRDDLLPG